MPAYNKEIDEALQIVRSGGVILYPTDTIWGLGCDATNPEAIHKIYHIKGREKDKPLLILVSSQEMLRNYVVKIPRPAYGLIHSIEHPLTIIYPDARNLPDNLTAADNSIGIRIVSHPFCTPLIEKLGLPLVSTSANLSGQAAPQTFDEITKDILQQVDYYVPPALYPSANKASSIYKILNDTKIYCIRE